MLRFSAWASQRRHASARDRCKGMFAPIIDRGTVIPVSRPETFHTVGDNQTQIEIEVFQGEHSMCADNVRLGQHPITGLPAAPAGEVCVDIRFSYDLNGISRSRDHGVWQR